MELTPLQIDLFKSLAGLIITVGLFTSVLFTIKTIIDRISR